MRAMANEFRAGFDELARQAELDELRKEVNALRQETAAHERLLRHDAALPHEIDHAALPAPPTEPPEPAAEAAAPDPAPESAQAAPVRS
jgi:sec-independent protein translocase protein TatB